MDDKDFNFADNKEKEKLEGDEFVLKFLDSMDTYLTLMDGLSSAIRQGWFDLASAKHSMGASRINTAMLDLKVHSASTTIQFFDHHGELLEKEPHFSLCNWGSLESNGEENVQEKSGSPQLRHRGHPQLSGEKTSADATLSKVDDQVQKERSKSLSVFGTLVSPKLRSSQLSFEAVLEKVVEIANMQSAILSSSDQIRKELECTKRMP